MDMVESMRRIGLYPQEILAVKEGIKPMLRTGTLKSRIKGIQRFCRENKLHCMMIPFDAPPGVKPKEQIYTMLISKSREYVKEYKDMEKDGKLWIKFDEKRAGELLGYPKCCIDFYQHKIPHPMGDEFSFILHTFSNTRGNPSFYTNNIFNFHTRAATRYRLDTYNILKDVLGRRANHFLISHIPCSYTCKESIGMGREVLRLLEGENQQLAKDIAYTLKKTFLVLDDFNWVMLDGKVDGNSVYYHKAEPFLTLYSRDKFIQGNKIMVKDGKIKIFNGDNPLHEIRKPNGDARIIDFRQ